MLTGCLKPTQLPTTLRGTVMVNQMPAITSMVVKGTAPLERLAHRNKLRMKKVPNTMPGTRTGVRLIFRFQASPPNILYDRADT